MSSVTVLSGRERRRRWSGSEKARIVEESLRPGSVVAAVAHQHDVHPNLLHHWRRQARLAAGHRANFLPIAVAPQEKLAGLTGGAIEIELGSGVRLRVDAGVDEGALRRVLRALAR